MSKPYKPRNPHSNSSYAKKRRREESERQIQELKDIGQFNKEEHYMASWIITIVIIGLILGFIFLIGGKDAVLFWLTK